MAAYETLVVTPGIANLIRENKTFRINSAIQTGAKFGMKLMDDSLFEHWRDGKITVEDALGRAHRADDLAQRIVNYKRGLMEEEPKDEEGSEPGRISAARGAPPPRTRELQPDPTCRGPRNMAIRRIGQILVDMGFIDDDQLEMLLEEQQQQPGEKLGKIAEEMGLITDDQLAQALAEQMRLQVINLSEAKIPASTLSLISDTMAQLYQVIPVRFEDNELTVATSEPQNLSVADELRTFLGYTIRLVVTTEREIKQGLDRYYNAAGESVESIIGELEDDEELLKQAEALAGDGAIDLTGAEALADSAPVRKLLNMVLLLAIKDHASDVHFEPFEDEFRIRIKADGVLYEMVPPPRHLAFAITTRIKVMANLDIAERRLPQDGRIELSVGGHPVDLRVSVLPTLFGESVVLRILDRSVVSLDLNKVGHGSAHDRGLSRSHLETERHYSRDRSHRFRQDHDALLGAE